MLSKKIFAVVMSLMMAGSNISVSAQPLDRMIVDGTQIVLNETDGNDPVETATPSVETVAPEKENVSEDGLSFEVEANTEDQQQTDDTEDEVTSEETDDAAEEEEFQDDVENDSLIQVEEESLQDRIDNLLTVEELEALSPEEIDGVREQVYALYDEVYDEEGELIDASLDTERLDVLVLYFSAFVETLDNATGTTIGVRGQIHWNDQTYGWNELTRPTSVPADPNTLIKLYRYPESDKNSATNIRLQSTDPSGANYCKITITEGEPYWTYSIGNVEKGENDHFYAVGPAIPSYKGTDNAEENKTENGELVLNYIEYQLDYQRLSISKTVIPTPGDNDNGPAFSFTVTAGDSKVPYKGKYEIGSTEGNGNPSNVHNGETAILTEFPSGVTYEIRESGNGYIVLYGGVKQDSVTGTNSTSGSSVEVTNISNNVRVTMEKKWNDNLDPTRSKDSFIGALRLEYRLGDGEWIELNADDQNTLGIEGEIAFEVKENGANDWTVTAKHGSSANFPAAKVTSERTQLISYRIVEGTLSGYIQTEEDGKIVNTKSADFTATIEWKDIDDAGSRPEKVGLSLVGYYMIGSEPHELEAADLSLSSLNFSHSTSETTFTVSNLPQFTKDGQPITYYVRENAVDGYSTKYDNGSTAFGTNTTQCYNGGKITNTRRDYTTFSATKMWVDADGDEDKRPTATMYLYRYVNGQSEDTASPVVILDKKNISHVISKEITGNGKFDFTDELNSIDSGHQLYKYDENGRIYIYFVKEVLTPKTNNGVRVSSDYYKEYKDADATQTTALYDGGTLTNRRIPMVDVSVGKTWASSSLPSVPASSTVALKIKKNDGNYVKDSSGTNDLTITLTGFSAEQSTKTQLVTLPKCDENGNTITYTVEETVNDTTPSADGSITVNGHEYKFTAGTLDMSTVTEPTSLDQNATADLIAKNALADQGTITVKKTWSGVTGYEGYKVKVIVSRKKSDGTVDETFTQQEVVLEGPSFQIDLPNMPLYDAEGRQYSYVVTEGEVIDADEEFVTKDWGVTYDYSYDLANKKETAKITNQKGGEGRWITVTKDWVDDGDTEDRDIVTAQVFDSTGAIWEGKTVVLSAANGWTARLGFTGDELIKFNQGITVKETKVGASEVDYEGNTEGYKDLKNVDKTLGIVRTGTNGYIFKVENSKSADNNTYTITNTRIGTVNVKITKIWQDGGRSNDERPSVTVKIRQNNEEYESVTITKEYASDENINQWVYTTQAYPKYDANGKAYVYTIEEVDTTALKDEEYVSTLTEGDYTIGNYHSGDVKEYTLTNKREGKTSYHVYKVWKDAPGTTSRPDIRVTLYYSVASNKDSEGVPVISKYGTGILAEYQNTELDYVWSTSANSGYDRMCTVPDLLKYSPLNGEKIIYYSQETIAVAGDYVAHYWKDASLSENPTVASYAADGEYIENRAEAKMNINGIKLWMNMQPGTEVSELDTTGITIHLYRYTGQKPADFEADMSKYQVPNSDINLHENSTLPVVNDENRKFLFENVDKYDSNGNPYTYEVRETITGNMNFVYNNDPSGFQITNNFITGPANNRTISVTKNWDVTAYTTGIKSSQGTTFVYPKVTFELYRSKGLSNDNSMDYTKVHAEITVSTQSGEESVTASFPDQLIFSENGVLYQYVVKEKVSAGTVFVDGLPAYTIPASEQTWTIDGSTGDYKQNPDTAKGEVYFPEKTAVFKNTYRSGDKIKLQGSKKWEDIVNRSHRPPSLSLEVYRSAAGTDASTPITEHKLTEGEDYSVTWTITDNDTWAYTIEGDAIVEYAPNGQRWTYRVKEQSIPTNYSSPTNGVAVQSGNVTENKVQNMTMITNSLAGTYTVNKVWVDNNNEYALRPRNVTVILQKKDGDRWMDVTEANTGASYKPSNASEDEPGTVSAVLSASNNWTFKFVKLDPTATYRCLEVAATTATGTQAAYYLESGDEAKPMIGSYHIRYEDQGPNAILIRNTLEPTTLSVQKKWIDDNSDVYDTRPKNTSKVPTITVTLQRAFAEVKPYVWSNVVDSSGNDVTRTLSSSTNPYTWEITNLPKCDYSGNAYVYRAKENENQVQSYTMIADNLNPNITIISNKLKNTVTIKAKKEWRDGTTNHPEVVLELTRWINEDGVEKKVSYPNPIQITLNGEKDLDENAPMGESEPWEATWRYLPPCDNDGKPYIYKVDEVSVGREAVLEVKDSEGVVSYRKTSKYLVSETGPVTVDNGGTACFTNTTLMEVAVSKTFANDSYATRPSSITVELQRTTAINADGSADWTSPEKVKKVEEREISGFSDSVAEQSTTFVDLPKYDEHNNEYKYRVVETKLKTRVGTTEVTQIVENDFASGYDVSYSKTVTDATHDSWTITNTMRTISISGAKEWEDQSNYFRLRPDTVTVKLYAPGDTANSLEEVAKQPTPSWSKNGDTWNFTFKEVPQYDVYGNKIVYTVKESGTINGYTVSNNALSGNFIDAGKPTATNPVTVDVSAADKDGTSHGIINTLDVVTVTGTKTWSENKNGSAASIRPSSITLHLMDGTREVAVPSDNYELTTTGDIWNYRYSNVPKYDATREITYTVTETVVDGYATSYDEATHKLVTNTLETTDVTAVKIWDDQSNAYNTRPSGWNNVNGTGLFTVYADGERMSTQPTCTWTQDTTDPNTYVFKAENLQKYRLVSGVKTEIVYTVQEDTVPVCYTKKISGTTITNTLTTVDHEVIKTFANDTYATRPGQVTVKLQQKVSTDPDWQDVMYKNASKTQDITGFTKELATVSYTVENLPKYALVGEKVEEIQYRVVETKIGDVDVVANSDGGGFASGYDVTYDYSTAGISEITNTMRTISVTGTKVWDDQNNIYGNRPEVNGPDVVFRLFVGSTQVTDQPDATWNVSGNNWTFTFTGLPQYDRSGTLIEYSVQEKETSTLADYAVTNNSLTGTYTGVANGGTVTLTNSASTPGIHNVLKTTTINGTIVDVDAHGSGTEKPVAGVTVGLYDTSGNAIIDASGNAITAVTDANGAYSFSAVPSGNYQVKEIDAPDGYLLNTGAFEVTVPANLPTENVPTVTAALIVDTPASSQLKLLKTDNETDSPISGVDFTIEGEDFRGNTVNKTLTTDENGNLTFGTDFTCNGLPVGTYTLTETRPVNYESPLSYAISVTNKVNGGTNETELSITPNKEGAAASTAGTDGVYTIVNTRIRRALEFTAVGTDDEVDLTHHSPIAGAVYGIFTDEAGTKPLEKTDGTYYPNQISNEKGLVSFKDLPEGEYYIKEITAPDNYTKDSVTYKITVNEATGVTSDLYDPTEAAGKLSVNEAIRGTFPFIKQDSQTGKKLQGSQYTLYKMVNGEKQQVGDPKVTNEEGEIKFENLLIGREYILEETEAPDGYQVSLNSVYFTYELDKTDSTAHKAKLMITNKGTDEDGSTITVGEDGVITWHEPPVCVAISKVDDDGNIVVGAQFRLLDENEVLMKDAEGNDLEWTSEENPKRIDGLLIADTKYILEEVSAPDGYVTADRMEFIVEKKKVGTEVYVQEVKMCNYASSLFLEKRDQSRRGLTGAVFRLEGKLADGTTSAELDFGALTEVNIKGLLVEGESYILTEIEAPSGYYKLEETITFDFKEKNELEMTSSSTQVTMDKEFNDEENRWICTIHVSNKKIPDPAKPDSGYQLVNTSDDTNLMFWLIMNLSSLVLAGFVFGRTKRLS